MDDIRRRKIEANLMAGLPLAEIAEAIGASPDQIIDDVTAILERWAEVTVDSNQIDLARLNRAVNAIWDDVQNGKITAIDTLIRIVNQRQRLQSDLDNNPFPASPNVPGQVDSRKAYGQLENVAGDTAWWDDYLDLRNEKALDEEGNSTDKYRWDWRKAVYIAWASMPSSRRWPGKQIELATGILGLKSDRTIRQWREKDPGIDERVAELSGAPILFKYRADVFQALVDVAKQPDPRAHPDRKLYLEMTGDYKTKQAIEMSGPDGDPVEQSITYTLEGFTDEQLDTFIANAEAAISYATNREIAENKYQTTESEQSTDGFVDMDNDSSGND